MKLKPGELHRHHLAYDRKGTGWRVDLGHAASVRIESGDELSGAVKKEIALRLAVCWNVLEGIPTEALLGGDVRVCFQVARELCDEIDKGKATAWPALRKLVATFRAADKALANVSDDIDCDCASPIKWSRKNGVNADGKSLDGRRVYEVRRSKTAPVWLKPPNKGWGPYSWAWKVTKGVMTGAGHVMKTPIRSFEEAIKSVEEAERDSLNAPTRLEDWRDM